MKILRYKHSLPLASILFVSAFAFGLFRMPLRHVENPSTDNISTLHSADSVKAPSSTNDSLIRAYNAAADRLINEKKFAAAITELEKALKLKPNDSVLKDKLNRIKGQLQKQNELLATSSKTVASGDAYFAKKDYLNAKSAYQLALTQNPDDAAAKEKLKKTMDIIRSQKAQNTLFDVAVAGADKLFQAGDYTRARQEYEKASQLLPGDPYPKNKINEIIRLQADQSMKEEEYAKAIAAADKAYQTRGYQNALIDYRKALKFKPDEKHPQERIKEITTILDAMKARDEAYGKAIALGDQLFTEKQYSPSLKAYKDALGLKPNEEYPRNRISEIEGIMARISTAQAEYDKYISIADSLYIEKQYMKARDNYLVASSVKPQESYPKEMVSKAEKLLTGQEAALAEAMKNREEQYKQAIARGDKAFDEAGYELAVTEYTAALELKPGESYPKTRIEETRKKIELENKRKAEDSKFAKTIFIADSLFLLKEYQASKKQFQLALGMKPDEAYPRNRINEIDIILAELVGEQERDARYKASIAKADKLFTDKSYSPARSEYSNAGTIKPAELYPKEKIAEIDRILGDLAAAEERYKTAIANGDQMLATKSYEQAKAEYSAALLIKPGEVYPKSKITEIEAALASLTKQKELNEKYNALIADADRLYDVKSWEPAKKQYQAAQLLKPVEQYPKERIAAIDITLGEERSLKERDDQYKALVMNADKLFASNAYSEAKSEYSNALKIKPQEQYPVEKIGEIDGILAKLAADKVLEADYRALITKADERLAAKSYEQSRELYSQASVMKPTEQYPVSKLAEIDTILANLAAQRTLDEKYTAAIARADDLFNNKSFEPAKTEYLSASALKPAEQYPRTRIGEIDGILQGIAKAKALEDQYAAAIAEGDKLFTGNSWEPARQQYQTAIALKPTEKYPTERIAVIEKILADLRAAKDLSDRYDAAVLKADNLFSSKAYQEAKVAYTNASSLKPDETYPKEKISEIEGIMNAIAAEKALEAEYNGLITKADGLLASKSYEPAREEYSKAQKLKSAEPYPGARIAEIDTILAAIAAQRTLDENYNATMARAEKLYLDQNWGQAKVEFSSASALKPAELQPKTRINEIDAKLAEIAKAKALEDQYMAYITEGDKLYEGKSWDVAREQYQSALKLKPAETYPANRIASIEKILADLKTAKERDDKYNAIIVKADGLLAAKSYQEAKSEYTNAQEIKQQEQYPKEKIAEIDGILASIAAEQKKREEDYASAIARADQFLKSMSWEQARTEYTTALSLKPGEKYPKDKIAEIDIKLAEIATQKAIDDQYTSIIVSADKLFEQKSYESARSEYLKAEKLKPAEQYPKTQLAAIDKAVAELARLKAIDDEYNLAIADADKLLSSKEYTKARTAYERAGNIKPSEKYPSEKISEIDAALAEIARLKNIDDQYSALIAKADQAMTSKSWEQARSDYNEALRIKPDQQYPKTKIKEIEGILAEIKMRDDAYNTAIGQADQLLAAKKFEEARSAYQGALEIKPLESYPKEKLLDISRALEELMGRQKYYDNLLARGDDHFRDKDYSKSKDFYQQALTLFPEEKYPKERIDLITARIDSLYRANRAGYDKAVADGDRAFNSYEFDKAIEYYSEAANLLPMESYPRDQIIKIRRTITENAIADVLNTTVVIKTGEEKQFAFTPVNIASRKDNFVYIKIRNLSGKPFNVLMRYGKDKQANGGIVMRNLNLEGKMNERLVSVKDQDLWYREDNNWISLYPQGGDIEVSFIQVSRARQ
jgi:tetratricopeptide (TPR) repeat protein